MPVSSGMIEVVFNNQEAQSRHKHSMSTTVLSVAPLEYLRRVVAPTDFTDVGAQVFLTRLARFASA